MSGRPRKSPRWKCPVCGTTGQADDLYAYRTHLIERRECREAYYYGVDYLKQSLAETRRRLARQAA